MRDDEKSNPRKWSEHQHREAAKRALRNRAIDWLVRDGELGFQDVLQAHGLNAYLGAYTLYMQSALWAITGGYNGIITEGLVLKTCAGWSPQRRKQAVATLVEAGKWRAIGQPAQVKARRWEEYQLVGYRYWVLLEDEIPGVEGSKR